MSWVVKGRAVLGVCAVVVGQTNDGQKVTGSEVTMWKGLELQEWLREQGKGLENS